MNIAFLKKTVLSHMAIWISYMILLIWFYSETGDFQSSILKGLFIVILQAGIFYLNLYFLLPNYFEKKKYTPYGIYVLGILIISLLLFYLFDQISFRYEFNRAIQENDWSNMPRAYRRGLHHMRAPRWDDPFQFQFIWRQLLFHGFFVVMVLFISTIYRNIKMSGQKEKEALELKSRVAEAESNMLKSQINPHFLFNTLNNIYSMAQLKSEKAPEAVHRLSEMLRYVIYDCNEEKVTLGQEIRYLRSYIELNLMKEEKMKNVSYDLDESDVNLKIAPMILVPFVENSFKHAKIEDQEHSWIRIKLATTGKNLNFEIQNTIPEGTHKKDNTTGIGLDNVKRRLQILYSDRHYLNLLDNGRIYKVELMLELS
jgi:sensor histidine kinase YesM